MPYRVSRFNGVNNQGSYYSMVDLVRIVSTFISTNGVSSTALQMKVSRNTVRRIVVKYRQEVSLKPGEGGNHTQTVMKDYLQFHIEFMLVINPKLYLSEIKDNLRNYLGLPPHEVPSLASIKKALQEKTALKLHLNVSVPLM